MSWSDYGITGHLNQGAPLLLNQKLALIDALVERYSVTSLSLDTADINKYKAQTLSSQDLDFITWYNVALSNIVKKYFKDTTAMTYYLIGDFTAPTHGWYNRKLYVDYFNCIYDIINTLQYISTEVNPVKSYLHNADIETADSRYTTDDINVVAAGYPINNTYSNTPYPTNTVFNAYFESDFVQDAEITVSDYNIIRLYTVGTYTENFGVWANLLYELYFNKVVKFGYGFEPQRDDLDYEVNVRYTKNTSIFYNEVVQFLYNNAIDSSESSGSEGVIQPVAIKDRMLEKIAEAISEAALTYRWPGVFNETTYAEQSAELFDASGVDPTGYRNYYIGNDWQIFIKPDFDFHA